MKNKIKLKKYLIITIIFSLIINISFILLNIYEYHIYNQNYNQKISSIVNIINEKYPNITEEELINILNNQEDNPELLTKYGIDLNKDSIILSNNQAFNHFLIIESSFIFFSLLIIIIIFLIYNHHQEKEIKNLTKYLEQINNHNYDLNIDSMSEDELSILKNEIYKTTIMLKETANNSTTDKLKLKESLEDISHQLKTPLTSILVMLDNLIDDEAMDSSTRVDFLRDIHRQIINLNFLVQSLLKLSKFDANTITFINEETTIDHLLKESIKNVSPLCDLKNIKIDVVGDLSLKLKCDIRWQIEALTNIIKNCVEHSPSDSPILIEYNQNNIYSQIVITDYGEGISKQDLKHIFERFYKGKNASSDSVGIGLALAKTIINANNGTIEVDSNKQGTKFIIKYY